MIILKEAHVTGNFLLMTGRLSLKVELFNLIRKKILHIYVRIVQVGGE